MANLTANVTYRTSDRGVRSYVVKNATTLYAGSLVVTDANGLLDNAADTSGMRFVGILLSDVVGDTSATPPVEGQVDTSGACLLAVPVTGVTARTDVNSLVYTTTGNPLADLSTTATTNLKAVGFITRWYSGTTVDVQLFTEAENYGL